MKEFLASYLLNLWVYGSQAVLLYLASRKLWSYYREKQDEKRNRLQSGIDNLRR